MNLGRPIGTIFETDPTDSIPTVQMNGGPFWVRKEKKNRGVEGKIQNTLLWDRLQIRLENRLG